MSIVQSSLSLYQCLSMLLSFFLLKVSLALSLSPSLHPHFYLSTLHNLSLPRGKFIHFFFMTKYDKLLHV